MPLNESEAKILMALNVYGPVPVMDLVEKASVSSGSTVLKAVDSLMSRGLVKDEREQRSPRRRMITLTGPGKRAAESLAEVERQIEVAKNYAGTHVK